MLTCSSIGLEMTPSSVSRLLGATDSEIVNLAVKEILIIVIR